MDGSAGQAVTGKDVALRDLCARLRKAAPRGWSVVLGHGEIVVRPADRGVGKFSVTPWEGDPYVMFFCRSGNIWCSHHGLDSASGTDELVAHMVAAADSTKRCDRSDCPRETDRRDG